MTNESNLNPNISHNLSRQTRVSQELVITIVNPTEEGMQHVLSKALAMARTLISSFVGQCGGKIHATSSALPYLEISLQKAKTIMRSEDDALNFPP